MGYVPGVIICLFLSVSTRAHRLASQLVLYMEQTPGTSVVLVERIYMKIFNSTKKQKKQDTYFD